MPVEPGGPPISRWSSPARKARALSRIPPLLFGDATTFDFWGCLPEITAPDPVVHGAEEPSPAAMAGEVAAAIPDARFRLLEDPGHLPFV